MAKVRAEAIYVSDDDISVECISDDDDVQVSKPAPKQQQKKPPPPPSDPVLEKYKAMLEKEEKERADREQARLDRERERREQREKERRDEELQRELEREKREKERKEEQEREKERREKREREREAERLIKERDRDKDKSRAERDRECVRAEKPRYDATEALSIIELQLERMRDINPEEQVKKVVGRRDIDGMSHTIHWCRKALDQMTQRDWNIFKEDFHIVIRGKDTKNLPNPMRCWKESGLPEPILEAIKECKFKYPSPVQMTAIPIGMIGRDVIGIAQTGSGKTAAFVIPMCVYISRQPPLNPDNGPYALVMAPTRELAVQIEGETTKLCKHMNQRVISIVGGVSVEEQATQIRKGAEIVIGTPGRLEDCIQQAFLVLAQCNYIVLDEADRMIDMGFEPQVNAVLSHMPATNTSVGEGSAYRQTFMFSATMPQAVEKLAVKFLRNALIIQIGEVGTPMERITQKVELVTSDNGKQSLLRQLVRTKPPPIIVFCNTKDKINELGDRLEADGVKVAILYGGVSQEERLGQLEAFKTGAAEVLIATDVAARGLDVRGVSHVINYDMPKEIQTYTHRIGRTGRAGASGTAISFVMPATDTNILYDLVQILKACKAEIPKQLEEMDAAKARPGSIDAAAMRKRKDTVIFAKRTQGSQCNLKS